MPFVPDGPSIQPSHCTFLDGTVREVLTKTSTYPNAVMFYLPWIPSAMYATVVLLWTPPEGWASIHQLTIWNAKWNRYIQTTSMKLACSFETEIRGGWYSDLLPIDSKITIFESWWKERGTVFTHFLQEKWANTASARGMDSVNEWCCIPSIGMAVTTLSVDNDWIPCAYAYQLWSNSCVGEGNLQGKVRTFCYYVVSCGWLSSRKAKEYTVHGPPVSTRNGIESV